MKKFVSWTLCFIICASMLVGTFITASALENNGFTYTVEDNKATITGYSGRETDLIIPAVIEDYEVIEIDSYAFYQNNNVVSVYISNGIETIDSKAFYNCRSLKSVVIPDSVTYIG